MFTPRPVANSLKQIVKPNPELSFRRHNCHILKVNYVSRRLKVSGHGYSGPKKVGVQQGIALGTADNPIVTTNNIAEIERQADGTWLCVAIRRKQLCATATSPTIDVEVDNSFDPFFSALTDDFGSTWSPDSLALPPIDTLGQLSLPDDRFTGETTYLCGFPPCTDCGTPTAGMALIFSSDAEHPGGCWKWNFRSGTCTASDTPLDLGEATYADNTYTLNNSASEVISGNYAYTIVSRFDGDPSGTAHIQVNVIDISNPVSPTVVGTDTYVYTFAGGSGFAGNVASTGLAKSGNYLYSTIFYNSTSPFSDNTTVIIRIDVSNPLAPVIQWGTNTPDNADYGLPTGFDIFTNSGDATVNIVTLWRNDVLVGLNTFGFAILQIGGSSATQRTTFNAPNPTSGWASFDFVSQFFYGVRSGDTFVDIVDVTDPDSPSTVINFNTGYDIVRCVAVSMDSSQMWIGATTFTDTGENNFLTGYDITTKSSPTLLSETLVSTVASGRPLHIQLCAKEKLFYNHANFGKVIEAYNISAPATPSHLSTLTLSDYSLVGILLAGSYLYANGVKVSTNVPQLRVLG